jgi:hypothetical protein
MTFDDSLLVELNPALLHSLAKPDRQRRLDRVAFEYAARRRSFMLVRIRRDRWIAVLRHLA